MLTAITQVVLSSPDASSSPMKVLYAISISSAMRRIRLSNSCFLPDADTTNFDNRSFRLNDEIDPFRGEGTSPGRQPTFRTVELSPPKR